MTDVTPKTPLVFGQSPLTGRIYAIRGRKREDVTDEFNRFLGRSIPAGHAPATKGEGDE